MTDPDLTTETLLNAIAGHGSAAREKLTETHPPDVVHAAIRREYRAGNVDLSLNLQPPYLEHPVLTNAGRRLQSLLAAGRERDQLLKERDEALAALERLKALARRYDNMDPFADLWPSEIATEIEEAIEGDERHLSFDRLPDNTSSWLSVTEMQRGSEREGIEDEYV